MPSENHTGRALSGAFALARFDRAGMQNFDLSYDGFWRSFNAIWVTLPVVFASAMLSPAVMERLADLSPQQMQSPAFHPGNLALYLVAEISGFVAGWLFFPLAMIWVARRLDMGDRYVPLIVARNWSRVITGYALHMPVVLFGLGLIGASLLSLLLFMVLIHFWAYRWFVVRTAVNVSGATAFGLLLFDVVGTVLVQGLFEQLYWLFDSGTPVAAENT